MKNKKILREGGATGVNIEIYQLESNRCRVYWYSFDQDGMQKATIATFYQKDFSKAVKKAKELTRDF